MSKVLVERELLERIAHDDEGIASLADFEELKRVLTQPAEAEGVEVAAKCVNRKGLRHNAMLSDYGLTLQHGEPLVRQSDHLAALSAVTAERDRLQEEMAELWKRIDKFQSQSHGITALAENERLRAEAEALRVALLGIASVNPAERGIDWAKAYASDGLSGTGSELYIRWLETFKEAEAVRKDAERYRWLRGRLPGSAYRIAGVIYSEGGDGVDAAVDAAMSAKEA
jgi:hypothetical protein